MPNLQRNSLLRLIMRTVYRVIFAQWFGGVFFRPSTLALFGPVLISPIYRCVIDTQ